MARETWSNKILYISTVAGATIGFGATWRFPYQVGQNGGGAYLLVFILAMLVLGIPMLMAEHIIGRRLQTNTVDAFGTKEANNPVSRWWKSVGIIAILGAFGILAYYMVLGGWVINYIVDIATKEIDLSTPIAGAAGQEMISHYFNHSISNSGKILLYTGLFVAVNYLILVKGIIKGIERMISYVMPLFLGIVLIMIARSLTLPDAMQGVAFYLTPDFSKINSDVFLQALGQVFFALSIGFGVMITLSSYLSKEEDMVNISLSAGVINTLIPLAIGFIIFPAIASAGIDPEAGPTLVFQVLPTVFSNMWGGTIFALLFFTLLLLAALTTSVTIYEVIITTLVEKSKLTRSMATAITLGVIFLFGNLPSVLSDGVWSEVRLFGRSIFDSFDYISANIFFISTSLLSSLFIGFVMGQKETIQEITNGGKLHTVMAPYLYLYLKFVIPFIILVIFAYSLFFS